MKEEIVLAPIRLTKTEPAPYARYMSEVDAITKAEPRAEIIGQSPEVQPSHAENNPKSGFQGLIHGDGQRAVSEAEHITQKQVEAKAEQQENLKKPNILQALWKALVEAFTKGKGLREDGVYDALALSVVFSEVIAHQPSEQTLLLSYLSWQKLAIENKESVSVLRVAQIGLQETKNAVIAKGIVLSDFEDKAKQYYVGHEKEISLAGLKQSIPEHADAESAKGFKARVEALTQHVEEARKQDAPILPGEIFSPKFELDKIMSLREQKEDEDKIKRPNKTHAEK